MCTNFTQEEKKFTQKFAHFCAHNCAHFLHIILHIFYTFLCTYLNIGTYIGINIGTYKGTYRYLHRCTKMCKKCAQKCAKWCVKNVQKYLHKFLHRFCTFFTPAHFALWFAHQTTWRDRMDNKFWSLVMLTTEREPFARSIHLWIFRNYFRGFLDYGHTTTIQSNEWIPLIFTHYSMTNIIRLESDSKKIANQLRKYSSSSIRKCYSNFSHSDSL